MEYDNLKDYNIWDYNNGIFIGIIIVRNKHGLWANARYPISF